MKNCIFLRCALYLVPMILTDSVTQWLIETKSYLTDLTDLTYITEITNHTDLTDLTELADLTSGLTDLSSGLTIAHLWSDYQACVWRFYMDQWVFWFLQLKIFKRTYYEWFHNTGTIYGQAKQIARWICALGQAREFSICNLGVDWRPPWDFPQGTARGHRFTWLPLRLFHRLSFCLKSARVDWKLFLPMLTLECSVVNLFTLYFAKYPRPTNPSFWHP